MSIKDLTSVKNIKDTPFGYTLSLISGKWKMSILYWLVEYKVIRYNELQRLLVSISYKTLSLQLKELEADGLIIRKEYPQIPPKVEYSLSEKGESLYPLMEAICKWGEENKPS
ncbi:MAG: winged helix-turn-helix transcriptional regulator [Peptostreptococcaceae bacterium]